MAKFVIGTFSEGDELELKVVEGTTAFEALKKFHEDNGNVDPTDEENCSDWINADSATDLAYFLGENGICETAIIQIT